MSANGIELFGSLYGTDAMKRVFSARERVRSMLAFEGALARVQAQLGIIPAEAAAAISRAADEGNTFDLDAIAGESENVGYPVVPLTRELARRAGAEGGGYVHWGATTQDVLDTALVLSLRDALALLEADLRAAAQALAAKAARHRDDVMAGRTHLQHALPITFGYKVALWLLPLLDHLERLPELRRRVLRAQLGGAVGTLASLGARGRAVTVALAAELGLGVPDAPWHADRAPLGECAAYLGVACGSLAKIATDVVLLAQTEVAEVSEPQAPGRGGSSTMPQKRNPIASEYVIACARGINALVPLMFGALAGDHERSTGPWQSEEIALPQIVVLASGAFAHARTLAEGMIVDTARMRRNLDLGGGLIMAEAVAMALAERIGKAKAHDAVERAVAATTAGTPFADALAADLEIGAHLGADEVRVLLQPERYTGESGAVLDRVLARAAAAGVR